MALGVIRVNVEDSTGQLRPANIMLNEGSDSMLIRKGLARLLGLSGAARSLNVRGTGGVLTRNSSEVI